MFYYSLPTARVIFTAKTILDVFSHREHVWTGSVVGDVICEMERVTRVRTAGGSKAKTAFAVL